MHNMQNRFLHINMINFILSMALPAAAGANVQPAFYIIYFWRIFFRSSNVFSFTMNFNYNRDLSSGCKRLLAQSANVGMDNVD